MAGDEGRHHNRAEVCRRDRLLEEHHHLHLEVEAEEQ